MDAINLFANIALPTAFGAPATPLQPGQVVQALVLELLQSGAFRLQLPQAVLDVRSDVPLIPGSTVTLAVKGTGSNVRLDILSDSSPAPAPNNAAGAGAAAQASRRPIGEAIIVGRTSLPDGPASATATPPTASATPAAPAAESLPARALAEAVQTAAARQGGLGTLFADAARAANTPELAAPVRDALTQLLGLSVPLGEKLTGADIKQAFARSGVLLEPQLAAAGRAQADTPPTTAAATPDLKAALLVLRQVLKAFVAEAPQASQTVASNSAKPAKLDPLLALPASASPPLSPEEAETVARTIASALMKAAAPQSAASTNPPPPYRGAPLTPQAPVIAALADDLAPRVLAEKLVADTDAALARTTLLQAASLPDAASLDAPRDAGPRWTFEVPFTTAQGTGIVPFEIARDGKGTAAEAQGSAWRARFSLDMEPMGPVHALVTITGDRASVTLWAERVSTASKFNDNAPMLGDALRAAELEPSELAFRVGSPRVAVKPAAPGRFMDRAS